MPELNEEKTCGCSKVEIQAGFIGQQGYTFVPIIEDTGEKILLGWENDGGLPNPAKVDIKGVTYAPTLEEDGDQTWISWTNDGGLPNPVRMGIRGGTFTPQIEDTGKKLLLSWSNDRGLPNPETIDVKGVTYTPIIEDTGDRVLLSWENDGGLPNPEPVDLKGRTGDKGDKGVTFSPLVEEKADGRILLSWENDGNEPNPFPVNVRGGRGLQGEQGIKGDKGEKGDTGEKGDRGDTGAKGDKGDKGDAGARGVQGEKGEQGEAGETGERGLQGEPGKDGKDFVILGCFETLNDLMQAHPTGEAGQAWTVGSAANNSVYLWDVTTEAWVAIGPIQGPKGDKGERGEKGEQGEAGQVQTIVAGENITIDASDPSAPVVSASGGGIKQLVAGTNVTVDNTDPTKPKVSASNTDIIPLNNLFTGVNTFAPPKTLPVKSDIPQGTPILGTGWTKNGNTYTHTAGYTSLVSIPIQRTLPSAYMELVYTQTGATPSNTFTIALATTPTGTNCSLVYNGYYSATSVLDTDYPWTYLNIIPTSGWSGTLTITSIKDFISYNNPILRIGDKTLSYLTDIKYSSDTGSIAIGGGCSLNTGFHNMCYGSMSGLCLTTGEANTFVGGQAGRGATTARWNTCLGYATQPGSNGESNVCVGINASSGAEGIQNIAIGANAAAVGGLQNIIIGSNSNTGVSLGSNQIILGANVYSTASNQITLGNANITQIRAQVTSISSLSDERTKEYYKKADLKLCADTVMALPTSRYKYKPFTGTHLDGEVTGFMADDMEKVFPKCVHIADQHFPVLDENGEPVMETVVDEATGEEREKPKTFLMENVKEIAASDQLLATLWGAVQYLVGEVELLKSQKSVTETAVVKTIETKAELAQETVAEVLAQKADA